jgi:hypothetical protein
MKWWTRRRNPSPELRAARDRLADVERDDDRVESIEQRAVRHIRENNLGPLVARALHPRTDT